MDALGQGKKNVFVDMPKKERYDLFRKNTCEDMEQLRYYAQKQMKKWIVFFLDG